MHRDIQPAMGSASSNTGTVRKTLAHEAQQGLSCSNYFFLGMELTFIFHFFFFSFFFFILFQTSTAFQDGKYVIKAVAIRDVDYENENELTFLQGEVISVIESRGGGLFWVSFLFFFSFFFSLLFLLEAKIIQQLCIQGRCEENEGLFQAKDVVFQGRNGALCMIFFTA